VRGDQENATEGDQHADPLPRADALAQRDRHQQDEDRRGREIEDAAGGGGVVQPEPLQAEVDAAAGEAQRRKNAPVARSEIAPFRFQAGESERHEDRKHEQQTPHRGDARSDVVSHRARDDPVPRP
jgi:hypothetical protein